MVRYNYLIFAARLGHNNRLDWKFWNEVFWMPNRKLGIKVSGFVAVMFSFGEISFRPSDPSSFHPKTTLFWVHMEILWHETKKTGQKFFNASCLVRHPETFLKFLVKSFWIAEPERPYWGLKILDEERVCFWISAMDKSQFNNHTANKT